MGGEKSVDRLRPKALLLPTTSTSFTPQLVTATSRKSRKETRGRGKLSWKVVGCGGEVKMRC